MEAAILQAWLSSNLSVKVKSKTFAKCIEGSITGQDGHYALGIWDSVDDSSNHLKTQNSKTSPV